MEKEKSRLTEAISRFNCLFNVKERFFIGAAIKDALVLGNRSTLLTEDEATDLQDLVENHILSDIRQHDEIRAYLNNDAKCGLTDDKQTKKDEKSAAK